MARSGSRARFRRARLRARRTRGRISTLQVYSLGRRRSSRRSTRRDSFSSVRRRRTTARLRASRTVPSSQTLRSFGRTNTATTRAHRDCRRSESRGATIGSLVGLLAGDPISRWTTVGVAPDNASIPLSSFVTIQVPANFVPAGQNWLPSEVEVQLVPLAGPINGRRVNFKYERGRDANAPRSARGRALDASGESHDRHLVDL